MTNIDFPENPSLNDTYTYGDVTFRFDGTRWTLNGAPVLALANGKIWIGDSNGVAQESDLIIDVDYGKINATLKSKGTVTGTVDLSAKGIGEITLAADTAFAFSGYELNKNFLLIINPNGFTPSFSVAARHELVEGNAEFDTTGKYYVNLTCIDETASSEILLTTIMKKAE
jgi:hypothetical protein